MSAEVDEYIERFDGQVRERLEELRSLIRETVPEAEERISYGMPAYFLDGPVVYFGGFKAHVGLYALPDAHSEFEKELSQYKRGKGSVQFPAEKPVPRGLVTRIVKFKADKNRSKK